MKLEKIRKQRKHNRWLDGLFEKNPILVGGLALPFAVMVSTSLKNALAISLVLAFSIIPTVVFSCFVGKYMSRWISIMVYTVFSMIFVLLSIPVLQMISPEIVTVLGIYIPIMAVNSLLFVLCKKHGKEGADPIRALFDGIVYSLGFTIAISLIGFFREFLGNHTIWGIPIVMGFKINGLQTAFAGFITVALFAALAKVIKRAHLCLMLKLADRENTAALISEAENASV